MASSAKTPAEICRQLRNQWRTGTTTEETAWPEAAWKLVVDHRLTAWTIPAEFGGDGVTAAAHLDGCVELARGHLGLALILSQYQAAVSRIVRSDNQPLRHAWLPRLAAGELIATVGLSHLSTSRQHQQPPVRVVQDAGRFELDGLTPWVTSAGLAELLVTGGVDEQRRQYLFAVPMTREGIRIEPGQKLVALNETSTAPIALHNVLLDETERVAGPAENVMASASGSGTGSLTTSALALGHAYAAIDELEQHPGPSAAQRESQQILKREADELRRQLLVAADSGGSAESGGATQSGVSQAWTAESMRTATTSLALRSCQTLVAASRGAGFIAGHPAERLMREALFFLVWSCPQEVVGRMMQEFSRCDEPVNDDTGLMLA